MPVLTMMRIVIHILLIGLWLVTATSFASQRPTPRSTYQKYPRKTPTVASVLICGSRSAYAYHSSECHGLNRCRSGISRVSISDARAMGYQPCKICY